MAVHACSRMPKQNHPNSRCQLARGTMGLGAYLRAPTPRDSRSVPSDRAKCHSDRAVRPLRFSRRRPRRADHHRHPRAVGWRGAVRAWLQAQCMGFYGSHAADACDCLPLFGGALGHPDLGREGRRQGAAFRREKVRVSCARLSPGCQGSRGTSRTRRGPSIFSWGGYPSKLLPASTTGRHRNNLTRWQPLISNRDLLISSALYRNETRNGRDPSQVWGMWRLEM